MTGRLLKLLFAGLIGLGGTLVISGPVAAAGDVPAPGVSQRIDDIKARGTLRVAVLGEAPWLIENTTGSGETRINVNDVRSQALSALLRDVVPQDRFFQVMDRVRGGRPFRNTLDFYFRTSLTMPEFKQIADRLTTRRESNLVGLINVNTAPRQVLLCHL